MTAATQISHHHEATLDSISTRLGLISIALRNQKLGEDDIENIILSIEHIGQDLNPVIEFVAVTRKAGMFKDRSQLAIRPCL